MDPLREKREAKRRENKTEQNRTEQNTLRERRRTQDDPGYPARRYIYKSRVISLGINAPGTPSRAAAAADPRSQAPHCSRGGRYQTRGEAGLWGVACLYVARCLRYPSTMRDRISGVDEMPCFSLAGAGSRLLGTRGFCELGRGMGGGGGGGQEDGLDTSVSSLSTLGGCMV